jgi:Ribonuclease G/E
LAEWYYENGIGQDRAILVDRGRIVEARIEPHEGVKTGLVASARLIKQLVAGKRGIARLESGDELLLSPLPAGLSEGGSVILEVTRAAIDEKSRFKLPLARAAPNKTAAPALTLLECIGKATICHSHQQDRFAEYGWHDVIEEARSGTVTFDGGSLLISITPAMTLIDVDGDIAPLPLALAAASAAAMAIRRLDIQGMIGIDFPGVANKAERLLIAENLDAAMTGPFERTAINGFGFLQLVKRRTGPSLLEMLQHRRAHGHAMELLRMAERDDRPGPLTLVGHPAVVAVLRGTTDYLNILTRRSGRVVTLRDEPKLAIGGYYAE